MSFLRGSQPAQKAPNPNKIDMKITIENLQTNLSSSRYNAGLDAATTVKLIGQLYEYLTGRYTGAITLPAPANDPDNKYMIMWPEGQKIRSSTMSQSSIDSKRGKDEYALSIHRNTTRAINRASSVTSSVYSFTSSQYIGIVDEEDDFEPRPQTAVPQPARLQSVRPRRTSNVPEPRDNAHASYHKPMRVPMADIQLMKPSNSIEKMIRNNESQSHSERIYTNPENQRKPGPRPVRMEPSMLAD